MRLYLKAMDIPWGDEKTNNFLTTIGLITSDGTYGPNIMACEWTHQVSYEPALFAIHVSVNDATHANIRESRMFGISIAASDQNVLASVAGGNHGQDIDKIKLLEELGFHFFHGVSLPVVLVDGAAFTAECTLLEHHTLGDHTMFVGQVVAATIDHTKEPLLYSMRKYWKRGEVLARPGDEYLARIQAIKEKHVK